MKKDAMPEEGFPNGEYMVHVEKIAPQKYRGENIRPTEYGVFLILKAPGLADRVGFFPWRLVQRIFQVGG